jgi:hypothetical protein
MASGGTPRMDPLVFSYSMLLTESFCANNTFVQQGFAFRESKTFDASDTPWVFEWGRLDDIELPIEQANGGGQVAERAKPFYPWILNTPEYRKDAQCFMTDARRKIIMHGFCCISYLRGRALAEWWAAYERAGPHERQQLGLNMRVVATHTVSFRQKLSKLASKCGGIGPSELVADYLFKENGVDAQQGLFVYSERPDFIPTGPLMWAMAQKMYSNTYEKDGRGHKAMGPCLEASMRYGQINSIQANSPFSELIRMQAVLDEMRTYNMDARAVLAHGQLYYEILPLDLKRTNIDFANTQTAFTQAPMDVLMNQALQEQRFALDEAAEILVDMQEEVFGKRRTNEMPIGIRRRMEHGRPDMREDIVRVPQFMKLAKVREPKVVDDMEKVEQEMRRQIAAILRLPLSMLESGSKSATPSGQANMMGGKTVLLSHEEGEVEDMVREERAFYGRFFLSCWLQTMGAIDIEKMDEIHNRLLTLYESLDARLARERLDAGNELFKELAPVESLGGTDDEEESTTTSSSSGEPSARRGRQKKSKKKEQDNEEKINNIEDLKEKTRVRIVRVRRLLEQLQTRHDCGATLVFQPSLTQDAMHSLAGVMELAALGVVSAKSMEPFAQAVYPGLTLREPPQPETAATATAKAPPPQKKAKAPAEKADDDDDDDEKKKKKKAKKQKKKKKKKAAKKEDDEDDDDDDDDEDAEEEKDKKSRGKKRKREEDDDDDDDDDDDEKERKKKRSKRAKGNDD